MDYDGMFMMMMMTMMTSRCSEKKPEPRRESKHGEKNDIATTDKAFNFVVVGVQNGARERACSPAGSLTRFQVGWLEVTILDECQIIHFTTAMQFIIPTRRQARARDHVTSTRSRDVKRCGWLHGVTE